MVTRLIAAGICCLLATACAETTGELTCDDVEDEAISLSDGNLIKITGAHETKRTDSELICHGVGFFSNGDETRTRYRAWSDEDGEIMIAWDTDEAKSADWARTVAQAKRENEEADRRMEAEIDRAFDQ